MTSYSFVINFPSSSFSKVPSLSDSYTCKNHPRRLHLTKPSSPQTRPPRVSAQAKATSAAMEAHQSTNTSSSPPIKLLFVEMGVGYDQHGFVLHTLSVSFNLLSVRLMRTREQIFMVISFFIFMNKVISCMQQARHYGCGHAGM